MLMLMVIVFYCCLLLFIVVYCCLLLFIYISTALRYYGLNAHEYDYEPRRYVSLVKNLTSRAPLVTLSSSVGVAGAPQRAHILASEQPHLRVPQIWLTLKDSASSWIPFKSAIGQHFAFSVSDVFQFVSEALLQDDYTRSRCKITELKCVGGSTVSVSPLPLSFTALVIPFFDTQTKPHISYLICRSPSASAISQQPYERSSCCWRRMLSCSRPLRRRPEKVSRRRRR